MFNSNFSHSNLFLSRGRPTRDIDNTCYIDPLNDPVHFCDSTDRCPGGCKTCAADDICDKIHETECVMSTEGTDNSNSAPTADGCNYFCTAEGLSGDVSYLVYSLRVSTAKINFQSLEDVQAGVSFGLKNFGSKAHW